MNIEFIKSEFEKLTLILRPWKEGQNISSIERDIVLDKLKNIYDAVRFADAAMTLAEMEAEADQAATTQPAEIPAHPAETVAAATRPASDADTTISNGTAAEPETEPDTEDEGDEVEVELIFSDEDEPTAEADMAGIAFDTDPADSADSDATPQTPVQEPAVETAAPAMSAVHHDTAADMQAQTETAPTVVPVPAIEPEAEPEAEVAADTRIETPAPTATATEATPASTGDTVPAAAGKPAAQHTAPNSMNSLFGSDEVKHRQPSRHHRMMSIYDYDTESKPEKVVNISKIFDNDDYAPDAKYDIDRYDNDDYPPIAAHDSDTTRHNTADRAAEESVTTLADAMSGSKQTLADTLTRPAPLAETITHRATLSLRDAIGINDKFLLIRDLFAGDDREYEKAIDELDSFDNLDDCMIYIVENYAWNPNSEGAKFIMQLLERKLS